jgi:hypothetical protein
VNEVKKQVEDSDKRFNNLDKKFSEDRNSGKKRGKTWKSKAQ